MTTATEVLIVLGAFGAFAASVTYLRRRSDVRRAMYDEWVDDIVRDTPDLKTLLEHFKHHCDEGIQEGVGPEWLASMINLLQITMRKKGLQPPTTDQKLQRLYLHWQKDPLLMTPPPQLKSLKHTIKHAEPPPKPRKVSERIVEAYWSQGHGS